jgi:hypothetical protein
MKHLKILGLAVAATALLAAGGPGNAAATTLEIGGVKQTSAVTLTATLEGSTIVTDEFGSTTETCTTSEIHGKTTTFTAPGVAEIHGNIEKWTLGNCTHTTTVIKPGKFYIGWESGTTNGTFTSSETEITVQSTFFGASAICKTGTGTKVGTITGTASGFATIDMNATIPCGILGNTKWTGSYRITSPNGLGVVE